jgi:Flp pilus assembly protein CpaB
VAVKPSTAKREAGSPKPARRRSGRRPSATHVLIAVVVILAFVLNLLVLQDRSATTLVALAESPLVAGSTMDPGSVRLVPVDSSFEGLDPLVSEAELSQYEGWVMTRTVPGGVLVAVDDLAAPGSAPGSRSMSLPVPIEHAAGGALVAGDRVDVISLMDGTARFIATGLEVVSVSDSGAGSIGSVTTHHVTVSVEADQALRLAEALDFGSIELLRSTGAVEVEEDGDAG